MTMQISRHGHPQGSVVTALRPVVIVLAMAALIWAHEGHKPLPTKGAQVDIVKGEVTLSRDARDALDVKTAEVSFRQAGERVIAYATLVAPWQKRAFVTTRVPGRITKLSVKPGQSVTSGQVLAEVDSLELKNITLELLNAQNDIGLSSKIMKELQPANKSGAVPAQRMIEAESKHQQNLNGLEIARSKWISLGLAAEGLEEILKHKDPERVRPLPILSPIQGVVIHADLTVGKVVDPAEHLFEIVDLSSVWAEIGVLEKDLHQVTVGQSAEFTFAAYPEEVFRAKVQLIGLYLDPETHLGTAWAELPNPPGQEPRLLPGMYGQARLLLPGPEKSMTVPAGAVIRDGAERYVLLEETATATASQFTKKNVVVGRKSSAFVEILSGQVFPGDRVVTQGAHELASFFVQGVLRPSPEAIQNIGLKIEPVQSRIVEDVIELDGTVDVPPDRRTAASSQLSGTLQKINSERGQIVHAGDVIAEVASLELQDLQLDLLRTILESKLLEDTVNRLQSAAESLPKRQIWEKQSLLNAALNRRASLEQKLEAVGFSHAQVQAIMAEGKIAQALPVRAPIDGVVVRLNKTLGQVINSDERLFEIQDLSQVGVQGYLSARDLAGVRIGQSARVRLIADPAYLGDAVVVRSGHIFGTESRILSVWAELKGTSKFPLQHNMLAQLTLTVRRPKPSLAVPLQAVVREGTRTYVFVQKPDGAMDRRTVQTGRADDRFIEITRGLKLKELIAVRGTSELQTAYAAVR